MWAARKKYEAANDNETPSAFEEDRNAVRRPIYREAFLYLPEAVRIAAVAMDISPLGARLRLARSCRLPEIVEVTVLDEVKRQKARMAWQDGNDIGLEFINPNLSARAFFETIDGFKP